MQVLMTRRRCPRRPGGIGAHAMSRCARAGLISLILAGAATAHQSPIGSFEFDLPMPNIRRVVAVEFDFHSGTRVSATSPPGRIELRDGRRCLIGPYFLLDVDDAFAFDIDETLTVEITVDRRLTDGFIFAYDAAIAPVLSRFEIDPGPADPWHTETIVLKQARLANRFNAQTDLALGSLVADSYPAVDHNPDVAVCDIRITRGEPRSAPPATATLDLAIEDADGAPVPARIGLYDPNGRLATPGEQALALVRYDSPFRQFLMLPGMEPWPGRGRYVFYVGGHYNARLPPGRYQLVVSRGPEYRIVEREITLGEGSPSEIRITLERWIDMAARGWYSGDDHIHVPRAREDNEAIAAVARAEDVHVANLLQMTSLTHPAYYRQYAHGPEGRYSAGRYALVPGEETPRTSELGHAIGLNTRKLHFPRNYFLYHETADGVHGDGGLFGYAHLAQNILGVDRGLALDIPFGIVDFVELLQGGQMKTEVFYDILNLGYRVTPTAGTDFPYLNLIGTERLYVRIDGEFSPAAWFDALAQGRTFITSGPMLEFRIDGAESPTELRVDAGRTLAIRATAAVNPDLDRLRRLELVVHGEVVAMASAATGSERLVLEHALTPAAGLWLAIRAYGEAGTRAHSAPVYVRFGADPHTGLRAGLAALVAKYQRKLDEIERWVPRWRERPERWDFMEQELMARWLETKPQLDARIAEARRRYGALLNR
jgi:hypothetical protein